MGPVTPPVIKIEEDGYSTTHLVIATNGLTNPALTAVRSPAFVLITSAIGGLVE